VVFRTDPHSRVLAPTAPRRLKPLESFALRRGPSGSAGWIAAGRKLLAVGQVRGAEGTERREGVPTVTGQSVIWVTAQKDRLPAEAWMYERGQGGPAARAFG